ncbi:iron complex outermembrane recepter protein [Mucilaginibacter lappiensis]|uniref:Iron complex outermembrane receptor protein n=1 Tax=Mucilaginibacter lappiensis TaxID=354630 RepID=A0ABR6PEH1_9SPHI|nr:TonB-dependent receptor [Mucilaginibacter lappiensis]MBB6107415.1 iron complex outermembrane receptor protein [Mucilaginibacter lappiensis]SIQ09394.1 iron complex outermembrane recepter protein [Mucilaginibacter lappiensis]
MTKKLLLFIVLFLFGIEIASAQKKPVTGTVTDAAGGAPMAGVSVRVKGGNQGTSTNAKGQFSITAAASDEIVISYTGYKTLTIQVNGRSKIDVTLVNDVAQLNEVVLIGTRSAGRVKLETAVPVDVVNVSKAASTTGRMDLTDILNYSAPSFNYNKQSGSDGADHVELGTLRGLGPDQTLVLVNGKRRHSTAFVSVFGTRGRGNSGVDLSSIPTAAIDKVEILRDGASAQYGSDAIAGVINLVLKKNINQFTANVGYSGYYDPAFNSGKSVVAAQYPHGGAIDGNGITIDANYGLAVGKNGGFLNLTGDYSKNGKTFRQVHDTTYSNPKALGVNTSRRANGDGSAETGTFFFNNEIPLAGTRTTFYSFGGYSYKASDDYAFSRNFSARPDRFPTTSDGKIIPVSGIIFNTPDGESYYNPIIQTHNTDVAVAAGFKGTLGEGWDWDLSNNTGNNKFHFFGEKTFNASLNATQTHFDDGGSEFLQSTSNLNINKHYSKVMQGLNLGFGSEYRYEQYKLFAGEEASYKNYDPTGVKAPGSQGFPGFQPSDVAKQSRSVFGAYVDLEADVTKKWLVDFANRLEHYSDFGYNFNTKLATRYKITDNFNIRASAGTGFRAPSLQQINYSSTFTNVQGNVISEVKIAPNYSPITKAAGIPTLKQEKSKNLGVGFTFKPIPELSITTDGYLIKVTDRVVLSGQFSAKDSTLAPAFIAALNNLHVGTAQFFANAVNTTNRGLDVVIDYNKTIGQDRFHILFTGNFQHMTIDKVNYPPILGTTPELKETFLSDREKKFILASAPPQKLSLNPEFGHKNFTIGTRFTYFGKVVIDGYGDGTTLLPTVKADNGSGQLPDVYNYSGKVVSDVYLAYKLNKTVRMSIGVDNVFNVHPDLAYVKGAKLQAYNNEPAGPFDAVQMGSNGRRLFARVGFNF